MTSQELDIAYTALANAIDAAGPDKAQLMLATLSLQLISERDDAAAVMNAIENALQLART